MTIIVEVPLELFNWVEPLELSPKSIAKWEGENSSRAQRSLLFQDEVR